MLARESAGTQSSCGSAYSPPQKSHISPCYVIDGALYSQVPAGAARREDMLGDTYRSLVVDKSKRADQDKDASDEDGSPGARRGRLARVVEDLSEKTHILISNS